MWHPSGGVTTGAATPAGRLQGLVQLPRRHSLHSRLEGCGAAGSAAAGLAQQDDGAAREALLHSPPAQAQAPGWQVQAPPPPQQVRAVAAQQDAARPPPPPALAPPPRSKSMVRLLGMGDRSSVGFCAMGREVWVGGGMPHELPLEWLHGAVQQGHAPSNTLRFPRLTWVKKSQGFRWKLSTSTGITGQSCRAAVGRGGCSGASRVGTGCGNRLGRILLYRVQGSLSSN